VLRVVANLALDAMRRRRPVLRLHSPEESDGVVERVALVQALRGLPRRQREVVVLRYLVDLSEQDVAAVLGIAPGTVKAHSHRGLAALRHHLGADIEEVTGAIT
jgi:RNA polymerase sigma factor (sigma-70 family)